MSDFKSLVKKRRNPIAYVEVLSLVTESTKKSNILGKITEQTSQKLYALRIFLNLFNLHYITESVQAIIDPLAPELFFLNFSTPCIQNVNNTGNQTS